MLSIAGLAVENNRSRGRDSMKRLSMAPFILGLAMITVSTPSYADRKHGDVENIGNRSVSGRIFGILPNFVSLE